MAQSVQETLMAFVALAGMAGMFFFAYMALLFITKAIEEMIGVNLDEFI